MIPKQYLTVGHDSILPELFLPIQNPSLAGNLKPTGGIWGSPFSEEIPNYNTWVEYLIKNPYLLVYKNHYSSFFSQPCTVINLKEKANILTLNTPESLTQFLNTYQTATGYLDYEYLSQIYDGIYIELTKLHSKVDYSLQLKLQKFAVDTLIIFHLDCIDTYQRARLEIEPFDLEYSGYYCGDISYTIQVNPQKLEVQPLEVDLKEKLESLRKKLETLISQKNITIQSIPQSQLPSTIKTLLLDQYHAELTQILMESNQQQLLTENDIVKLMKRKLIK